MWGSEGLPAKHLGEAHMGFHGEEDMGAALGHVMSIYDTLDTASHVKGTCGS